MSVEYDAYLSEHIANVQKALRWMADTIFLSEISHMSWSMAIDNAQRHDESKNGRDEYNAYDRYFYGGNKTPLVQEEFDRAWLHHQKVNPHHWQYWVLINDDDGKNKALQMPVCYVLEMIADWWSFSWKNEDLMEIFKWYKDHEKTMVLHDETRKLVEKILDQMYKILTLREGHSNEDETEDVIEHSDKDDDEKEYGVPEQKKFPLPDADHVRSAIRFFNYVDPKYEQELADAINKKIAEYEMEGIHVGDENRFKKYVKEEYLEHHGILGQKWGIRRYQNPDGSLTPEGYKRYAVNNLKNAKSKNVDKWGKSENTNVLYITGQSGSGKSTIAKALENDHINVIHLDSYFDYQEPNNSEFNKHLDKTVSNWRKLSASKEEISLKDWGQLAEQFETEIEKYGQEQYKKGNKVIVEGVHLSDDTLRPDKTFFKDKPIIIVETNGLASNKRAAERDEIPFSLSEVSRRIHNTMTWRKELTDLEKAIDADKIKLDYDELEHSDVKFFDKAIQNLVYDEPAHLEHHGILGQKWGQRNGPPYPLNRNALDSYDKEKITESSINKYKDQAKQLSHVRVNKDTNGTIFTDDGKLIGMVNVEAKDDGHRWIQGLELFGDGKGKGLSYDLLDYATDELGATHLSVNKANTIAKHVYDKYGFKTYDETDDMYFMKIDDHIEHHGILGQKWGIQNGPPYPIGSGGVADRSHYNNHTVFVSGSSKTTTEDSGYYRKDLPESIRNELKRHMHEGNKIIVGDAPGIDRQVQDFLNENDYYNVEVYGPGKKVRYSANSEWKTNPIDAPEYEEGSKEWLAKKDIAMSKAANEGLAIILDEGATATRKNVKRLKDDDKDVKVFSLGADGNDNWVPDKMIKEIT